MNTLIDGLRQILGTPNFYDSVTGAWDYDLAFEYFVCAFILTLVVGSIFKVIARAFA